MKKYVYEYLSNIEKYGGWNIEKIIEKEKMLCIRVLYDDEYCKEILGDKENEKS